MKSRILLRSKFGAFGLFTLILFHSCTDTKSKIVETDPISKITQKYHNLFSSVSDFRAQFNTHASSINFPFQIENINIETGEVNNVFKYIFTNNLVIIGTIDKPSGSVKDITMMANGDGTNTSVGNMLLCMISIIATVDPNLPAAERNDILKNLHMYDEAFNIGNMTTKASKNGNLYTINSSPQMGFWFTVEKD